MQQDLLVFLGQEQAETVHPVETLELPGLRPLDQPLKRSAQQPIQSAEDVEYAFLENGRKHQLPGAKVEEPLLIQGEQPVQERGSAAQDSR